MTDATFTFDAQETDNTIVPFSIIYGPSGVGKTTLASQIPNTVFIQTESGQGELKLRVLKKGVFTSVDEIMAAIKYIYANPEGIKNVALDSLDHLEPLVWDYVCKKNDWDSIEAPGYGKGYIECDKVWMRIITGLKRLRDDKGITITVLAHELVRQVNDPQNGPYDAHEMKMHKRAVALWKESCDLIGLLKNTVVVDSKTGKGKGGTSPTLYVRPNAAYTAKTRFKAMPASIPISLEDGWAKVAKYMPFYNEEKPVDTQAET